MVRKKNPYEKIRDRFPVKPDGYAEKRIAEVIKEVETALNTALSKEATTILTYLVLKGVIK